jgi:hypothetical protein
MAIRPRPERKKPEKTEEERAELKARQAASMLRIRHTKGTISLEAKLRASQNRLETGMKTRAAFEMKRYLRDLKRLLRWSVHLKV